MTNALTGIRQAGRPASMRRSPHWVRLGREALLRWASLLLIFLAWFVLTNGGFVRPDVLPSPTRVFAAACELIGNGRLPAAVAASLLRAGTGALLGILRGIELGLLAAYTVAAEVALDRPMQMLKAIPFNGLVPILIVALGIGEVTKVMLIGLAVLVPVYLGTFAGVRGVDAKLVEVAVLYGVPEVRIAFKVLFLGALPSILNAIRFALAIAWIALVTSETVNAQSGLGYSTPRLGRRGRRHSTTSAERRCYAAR